LSVCPGSRFCIFFFAILWLALSSWNFESSRNISSFAPAELRKDAAGPRINPKRKKRESGSWIRSRTTEKREMTRKRNAKKKMGPETSSG